MGGVGVSHGWGGGCHESAALTSAAYWASIAASEKPRRLLGLVFLSLVQRFSVLEFSSASKRGQDLLRLARSGKPSIRIP